MFLYEDVPSLAWNRIDGDMTVVVEDIPSAMKLSVLGYRAVALNGTHATTEAIEELDRNSTDLIWALDRDAFDKACRYPKDLRMYFRRSLALLLPKDFKDMEWKEIHECLSEIYWDRSSRAETPMNESGG